ncbi:UNVERIFIED_CONTAM: Major facilitator super domain-containing protein 7 [Siphonaria sp. JEL0065]|nr:Major facilitator super domain-containing protein 7 [Siphonaria sp. JEL0065]
MAFLVSTVANEDREEVASVKNEPEFPLDRWRFFVAGGVFWVTFANNMLFGTYGAVTPTTALRYGTDSWTINMLNMINCAMYLPAVWPSSWLLDTHGLRPGVLASAIGTILAALLRWLSFLPSTQSGKIAMLVSGTILAGFFGLPCQNASTKAAAHWFSGNGRLTANAVMSIATPLGVAAGQFIGPLIVNSDPNNVDLLNFCMFVISALCSLGVFLVYNNPACPPSASAKQGTLPYREGLKHIAWNGYYWIAVFVGSCAIAATATMSTYASNYVVPYGYSEDLAGNLAIAMFAGGIVTAIVLSRILDFTKAHIPAMKILSVIQLVGIILFYIGCVNLDLEWLTYVGCLVVGMGAMPMVSVSLELAAEATFPIAEATSSGILLLFSQILTVIMIILSNALSDSDGKMWKALIMLIVFSSASVISALFYNTPNRRIELERKYELEMSK